MDLDYIEHLAQLLRGSRVRTLTVRRRDQCLTLTREPNATTPAGAEGDTLASGIRALPETAAVQPVPLVAESGGAEISRALVPEGSLNGSAPAPPTEIVRAHRVGIFHRAAEFDGEALAAVGDWLTLGRQLGSIECMDLYDEIDCPAAGRLLGVFVDDGQPVEFGQPLFHLELGLPPAPEADASADAEAPIPAVEANA